MTEYINRKEALAIFAGEAVRISPYDHPENLEKTVVALNEKIAPLFDKFNISPVEPVIEALGEFIHTNPLVAEWNKCKKGATPQMMFVSAFDPKGDPDYDFMDLHALEQNVRMAIYRR